ncbi:MAG TPA: ATP-binding protein [Candidatus Acidoferrales bacterium]|jgi:two-component system sensor kinase FixL|nr:ATP-binding protein [Candidatus Acidoferrales bacterium]
MNRFERFLAYAESHRPIVWALSGVMIAGIVAGDWILPNVSVGFLYLLPVLFAAATLNGVQIAAMAVLCGYLREAFDPLQTAGAPPGSGVPAVFNPLHWAPGASGRLIVVTAGFAMTGFFVAELNQRRRLLAEHLKEREQQILLRHEAELQVRVLIETSPLAILTLDHAGRVVLANESASELLEFDHEELQGCQVEQYLPTLYRMLNSHRSGNNMRTSVECKGQRRNGEVFLAHVWLSTYHTSSGPSLAAVVWDASENLRDREGAGLDSMMATSRVLIGAISHEVRNLASAAATAYVKLGETCDLGRSDQYHVLGTLVHGLEKIASSGLRVAASREAVVADLGTVLDEARIVIEPSLREADIAVFWDVKGELPLVQADHHSLLQVFVNLARNSRQALENCTRREVRISAELEKDLVVVRFRDTGPGVERPEELFRPFQSGTHSAGLGLYISRAILRSHGGGLRYEPETDGSCFAVELWPVENSVEG